MRSVQTPRRVKKLVLVLLVVATAALIAPAAAQAEDDELALRVVAPLLFLDPTASCPFGVITFGLSSEEGDGSGTACVLSQTPVPCHSPDGCQEEELTATLTLPDGAIELAWTQPEIFSFDPHTGVFTVFLTFDGMATGGTGDFEELVGAPVSGGGRTDFAPDGTATPHLLLLIGEEEEDDERDDDH